MGLRHLIVTRRWASAAGDRAVLRHPTPTPLHLTEASDRALGERRREQAVADTPHVEHADEWRTLAEVEKLKTAKPRGQWRAL